MDKAVYSFETEASDFGCLLCEGGVKGHVVNVFCFLLEIAEDGDCHQQ